MDSKSIQL